MNLMGSTGNWFNRRLIKTTIITVIVLCVLNFIGGFASFFFAYFFLGFLNEVVVVITAFLVNFVVLILVARSTIREIGKNLRDIMWWLVILSGFITLFAFLGFKALEAMDRAYPSF